MTAIHGANAMQAPEVSAQPAHAHMSSRARRHAPTHSAQQDNTAKPATVLFENGKLQIAANNSDLSQILEVVAAKTGMAIDGSISPARVFGVYGPYHPQDVLRDLLTGSGYNFILVGDTPDSSPRRLLLMPQTGTQAASSLVPLTAAVVPAPSQEPAPPQQRDALQPVEGPPAPSQDQQERMRQRLDRLEQMRSPMKPPASDQ